MDNIDTLKKYIQIGFDKKVNLTASNTSVWKDFAGLPTTIDDSHYIAFNPAKFPRNTPLSLNLKNGDTWYKMAHATNDDDKYVLAYR